jgi:hypothetical protein
LAVTAGLLSSAVCAGLFVSPARAATSLVSIGSPVRILVPTDDSLGSNWRNTTFNDATWLAGTNGVGYETGPGGYTGRILADSQGDWSGAGVQGEDRWINGYYNKSQDADGIYQANNFQPFPRSDGPWSPINFWDGGSWNWNPDNVPWDTIGRVDVHPNGINNGDEHWVIRRWVSTYSGLATFRFHLRKSNLNGTGVTGKILHAGEEIFSRTIAGNDGGGFTVFVTRNINVGDVIDFAQTPLGVGDDQGDGADGSVMIARVIAGTIIEPLAVTDSVAAWVPGVQGANGWYYGFYNKTADGDGTYNPATDFNATDPNWTFNGNWVLGPGDPPWDTIGQTDWHPNGDNNVNVSWVIKRWVSTLTGDITARISFGKSNPNCGNGTTLRVLHNGVEKFSRTVAFNDSTGFNTDVVISGAAIGDHIEFALDPLGTDGLLGDGCDGSRLRASIYQGSSIPPFQQSIRDCFTTDLRSQMQDISSSVYLRFPFNVPDLAAVQNLKLRLKWNDGYVAYLNGTEISKANAPSVIVGVTNANSTADWSPSGTQGENSWTYGYYDRSTDGDGTYSAGEFQAFPRDGGGHSPTDFWSGSQWDWFAGNPPWDEIGQTTGHPNHPNGNPVDPANHATHEHWVIRRWNSTVDGNLRVRFQFRKTNPNCGDGVVCKIFHNGVEVYSQGIASNDAIGRDDVVDLTDVFIGDTIDLALTPGAGNDFCDGSAFTGIIFSGQTVIPFNGAATDSRTPESSVVPDLIDLTSALPALRQGANVLAIQGLNRAADDANFLIAAELTSDRGPSASDDNATVNADATATIPTASLLGNDSDPDGDALYVVGVNPDYLTTAGGAVRLFGTIIQYTPPTGFTGADSFRYTISSGGRGQASATVRLNVVGAQPPTVAITSPAHGATLPACATATICAEASASGGATITTVAFFANGSVALGAATTAPYCVSVPNAPAGVYDLTAIATDSNGSRATSAPVRVTVEDGPPVVNCPNGLTMECTGGLTVATYEATAVDQCDGPLPVTCVPPSGSGFQLGTSNVVCTATDLGGRSASCTFTVTVRDTMPPEVGASLVGQAGNICGQTLTFDATNGTGAVVLYVAGASDVCGIASFNCEPRPPDSIFPIGTTTVTCTATDRAGNASSCSFTIVVRGGNRPPMAVINSEQLIDLSPEFEHPVLISCNWWNACLVADGWTSSDPDPGDTLTYVWFQEPDGIPIGVGPIITNCLEVGDHTITLDVTDSGGLTDDTSLTISVVTAPLAIELLIERINESHKHGVVLSRKTKRELTATLRVALEHAGAEKLRETQKALDAFEKKVRAQVAKDDPEAATLWIRWSQAISEGMEKCLKPPRKLKDHNPKDPTDPDDPTAEVCLNGQTLVVPLAEVPDYLGRGATLGPCDPLTIEICFQGATITVRVDELQSFLDRGAFIGPCEN